jgi:dynein heavy chain 1
MVWFSEDVLSTEMIFENYLARLRNIPLEETDDDTSFTSFVVKKSATETAMTDLEISPSMQVREYCPKMVSS